MPDDIDAHALNNCLAIILGYADLLLQESAPDDPRRQDFEEMHRAAAEAVTLVSSPAAKDE